MTPATAMVAVVAWAVLSALGASTAAPSRSHIDDKPFLVEVHIENTGPFQTQQGTE
jgi:hypothetical protein